jgi:phage baseplate assembly protein W
VGAIRLTGFEKVKPQSTVDDFDPSVSSTETYVYKDIKLDFALGDIKGQYPANKKKNTTDIQDNRDIEAIIQSVTNIFNTSPGQKLLNPYLGVNLSRYLFDPITVETGDLIARQILKGLAQQEPRINLTKLFISCNEDEHQYEVQFILEFPGVGVGSLSLNGVLNRGGMQIQN